MATLHLMCGMAGAGKTTRAKEMERVHRAVRFSPDEWIERLLEDPQDRRENERLREIVERIQWETAQKLLVLGTSVILENGFWGRDERDRYRNAARQLGARVELHYLDVPHEELWNRIRIRNEHLPEGPFQITRHDLDLWMTWFQKPDAEELATYDNFSNQMSEQEIMRASRS